MNLLDHLAAIRRCGHALAGVSIVNQRFIKKVGLPVWEKAHGQIPSPSSTNNKNRPRVLLGGYVVDGEVKPAFEVLVDDLAIIGWIAMELGLIHKTLCETTQSVVALDVIMDRMPNDQGRRGTNKAELLKYTLETLFCKTIHVIGVPDIPDHHQRDLLVDNIAGLGRHLFLDYPTPENEKRLQQAMSIWKVTVA